MSYQYPNQRQAVVEAFFALGRMDMCDMSMGKKVVFLDIDDKKNMYIRSGTIYDVHYGNAVTTFSILSDGTHYTAKSIHIRKPAE